MYSGQYNGTRKISQNCAREQFIDATVKHMDTFANEGLRTLVIAQAELDPEAYEEWADQYEEVRGCSCAMAMAVWGSTK